MAGKKVKIVIEKGKYEESHKNGRDYTSVSYFGSTYGASSPCDSKEQIENSIRLARERIEEEGDTPIILNLVELRTLQDFCIGGKE